MLRPADDWLGISCVVETRWFLGGDSAADLPRGAGRGKDRVDSYHIESLSGTASGKRGGRPGPFEEKWRVGKPTEFVLGDVVGQAEAWRKRRLDGNPRRRGNWIDVHKRIWTGRAWEIARLDVSGRRSWTVALTLPCDASGDVSSLLASWWAPLRENGVAASYAAWLATISEELAERHERAVG